jgi:hypothetical protein
MNTETRSHVHALIDQLPPVQLAALETILQSMLDPLSRKLALAPIDDEPFTEEDLRAVAEADEWSKHNEPIPLETVLTDLGLTMADWETMAKTPLPDDNGKRNA